MPRKHTTAKDPRQIQPGDQFGDWTAEEPCASKKYHWVCHCKCGTVRSIERSRLTNLSTVGCPKCKFTRFPTAEDHAGKTFGDWTVISREKGDYWLCRCSCGTTKSVCIAHLIKGASLGCSDCRKKRFPAPPIRDLSGETFGRWTVIGPAEDRVYYASNRFGVPQWICLCECGLVATIPAPSLTSGNSKGCGCQRRDLLAKIAATGDRDGLSHGPEYKAWYGAIDRCYNPDHISYHNYGGRGICVCDRWLNSFAAFLEDMGSRPSPDHSIDRHPDNDGNYEPGNVRWATPEQQSRNRRNTVLIVFRGEAKTTKEWSEITGLKEHTIRARHNKGWDSERTLTTPVGGSKSNDGVL